MSTFISSVEMDDETRLRVLEHIADFEGCSLEEAVRALWAFENVTTSEGETVH
jgi:hypothetical protein